MFKINVKYFVKKNILSYVIITSIILLGLFLRVKVAYYNDFWINKSFSLSIAQSVNFSDLFFKTNNYWGVFHPSFYYILLKFWIILFSNNVASARSLSILFYFTTAFILYKLCNKHLDKSSTNIWILLFAIHPFLVNLGFQARMYASTLFLCTTALYFILNYLYLNKNYFKSVIFLSLALYFDYLTIWVLGRLALASLNFALIEKIDFTYKSGLTELSKSIRDSQTHIYFLPQTFNEALTTYYFPYFGKL